MTNPGYLLGEMLNLITANIPGEVYVVTYVWKDSRTHAQGPGQADVIGTFSNLKLANHIADVFHGRKDAELRRDSQLR